MYEKPLLVLVTPLCSGSKILGRLREEEELVQVPVALRRGWVAEGQPLPHNASCVGGLDAAL